MSHTYVLSTTVRQEMVAAVSGILIDLPTSENSAIFVLYTSLLQRHEWHTYRPSITSQFHLFLSIYITIANTHTMAAANGNLGDQVSPPVSSMQCLLKRLYQADPAKVERGITSIIEETRHPSQLPRGSVVQRIPFTCWRSGTDSHKTHSTWYTYNFRAGALLHRQG